MPYWSVMSAIDELYLLRIGDAVPPAHYSTTSSPDENVFPYFWHGKHCNLFFSLCALSCSLSFVPIPTLSILTPRSRRQLNTTSFLQLLTNMRFAFQRAYSQLRDMPNSALNNVRREFHSAVCGASKRLDAWEAKRHVSKDARLRLSADREAIQELHWWHSGLHAVPGGNVIV
jgi:hypothetical protein